MSLERKGVVLWWQTLNLACKPLAWQWLCPRCPAYKIGEVLLPELLFKTGEFMIPSSFLSLSGSQWLHLKMETLLALIYHVSSVWNLFVSCSDFWSLVLDSLCFLASRSHPFSFVSLTSWMMKTFSSPAEISSHTPLWVMVHTGISQEIKSEFKSTS